MSRCEFTARVTYLRDARLTRRRTSCEALPEDVAAVLDLQANDGRWQLSERMCYALGHTKDSIPNAPNGVKDWLWATALAVISLRRRPDMFDQTYDTYRSGAAKRHPGHQQQSHRSDEKLVPLSLSIPYSHDLSHHGHPRLLPLKSITKHLKGA